MEKANNEIVEINENSIKDKIYIIRNQKVMIDSDLAEIYGYTTKTFNQQVKNNIEKFEEDFRFQLTDNEVVEILRSKNLTSMRTKGKRGGRTYNPYAFTEQGIYMLMTVLKGELAIRQSKALIRTFKEMKDYVIEAGGIIGQKELLRLSLQTTENARAIRKIEEEMTTKKDLIKVMKNFIDSSMFKEFLILDGQAVEADIAYTKIYSLAKESIYVIDNYIGLKTLALLKNSQNNVKIIIFSDNIGNSLHKLEYKDFVKEYPNINISFKITNNIYHDRYIIIDYKSKFERIYHCGASSKDAGKRITTIVEVNDTKMYYSMIDELLKNQDLVLK
ncbi:MAG: ORF6N domain-containing protein [Clostridia bacterium]|nr:ORF6N domain-containing protein [Clostridia bacterium]